MRARSETVQGGPLLGLAAVTLWFWGGPALAAEPVSAERIQADYREILNHWSAGQVDQAPDELIRLETSVIAEGNPESRKRLLQEEQRVLHAVGESNLEAYVPIAMLHHETYRRYLERGERRSLAMIHARSMARDLAIRYWQDSGSLGSALVASQLLASLGGMLQQSAQQLQAGELFQQALELDGRNPTALLGLATLYEKNSQFESAVKGLRRLLEVEPGHAEARLRLALSLRRQERPEPADLAEARKLLEELTAASEPSWLGSLPFQELARLHSEEERTSEAEKVLRAGLERFPGDVRLHVQLAAVLDRRGESAEAASLVDKALALPRAAEGSSRYFYNKVRPETFAAARSFLTENSRSRLAVLAQALGAPGERQEAVR